MSGKKYSHELNKETPINDPSFIEANDVRNVRVTIEEVRLDNETRKGLKSNASHNYHIPQIDVRFKTDTTQFWSNFFIDPLIKSYYKADKSKSFTSLVSSSYVEWNNLNELVGSETTLCSPMRESSVYIQDPLDGHNYNVLAEIDKKDIYCDGISDYFVDVFVDFVENKVRGRATITDLYVRSNTVKVIFELPSGDVFKEKFRIKRDDEESNQSIFEKYGPFSSSGTDVYDFWDLCEDSLGYIPADSNYEKIIGESVKVNFNGTWTVENSPE